MSRAPGSSELAEAELIEHFRRARRDPDLAVLEGFHALKQALRFGAEIVQFASDTQEFDISLAATELPRQAGGEFCHTKTMARDCTVVGIDGHGAKINSRQFPSFRPDRVSPQNTPKPLIEVRA
jgi:hypothetical protein